MSSRPLVQLLGPQWVGGLNHYPMGKIKLVQQAIGPAAGPKRGLKENAPTGKNKLVQQAINPAAGPIAGWRIQPFPNWENKLVQQAIGPAAGPIAGWRIKPLPYWEDQACPAGQLVQLLDP